MGEGSWDSLAAKDAIRLHGSRSISDPLTGDCGFGERDSLEDVTSDIIVVTD